MPPPSAMISAAEATEIIRSRTSPLGTVTVAADRAAGLVLAESIAAADDIPPFDNAAMDGFAVNHADVAAVPAALRLAGEIAAGSAPSATPMERGTAVAIMTGGPIPRGCSAVVQQEWTEPGKNGSITIVRPVREGHNIRKAGADISRGAAVFAPGALIRPQEIGVLASVGRQFVAVHRRPSAAVIATGSEIVEPDAHMPPGKIRNSSSHAVAALAREAGCDVRYLGIARDDKTDLRAKLMEGLRSDILITCGGVSVGAYDLVKPLLEELGARLLFTKVKIKPGMPLVFGIREKTLIFGLPGNPVSGMVTFIEFVRPAIRRLMGDASGAPLVTIRAALAQPFEKRDGKRHFVRGVATRGPAGDWTVGIAGSQVSNVLTSMTRANCLIVIPEETEKLNAGDGVDLELLP